MSERTKKIVEKAVIIFSPIFTLIMYSLPWMGIYKRYSEGKITTDVYGDYYSCIDLLKSDLNVYTKVIIWISILGVISSIILYLLSVLLRDKELLFTKIASSVLVGATGVLYLSIFAKLSGIDIYGGVAYKWADFMTPLYGVIVVYNVGCLIYIIKKQNKIGLKKTNKVSA